MKRFHSCLGLALVWGTVVLPRPAADASQAGEANFMQVALLTAFGTKGKSGAFTKGSTGPLAEEVRIANGKYADVAVALEAGYVAMPCASGAAGGAMGYHYVNAAYLRDAVPDISRPQALMYEPMKDGSRKLVAVEYVTFKGPASLHGQLFNFVTAPNRYGLEPFYELHVWAWKNNPSGIFADYNPTVSCALAD